MNPRRVLLKLSGEALAGDNKTGFDEATVKEVARQVKISVEAGVQVGVVIGGGNFWRGRTSDAIDRPKADQIGMGCVVNGPGEAREADLGIAGGIGEGLLMKKGEIIRKVPEDQLLGALKEELMKMQ